MRKFSQVLLFVILPTFVFAQNTVSGTVSDASTGEALPGANVVLEGTNMVLQLVQMVHIPSQMLPQDPILLQLQLSVMLMQVNL